ncbi:MAG: amidase [Spongiibacteraceae bacterium]
MSQEFTRRDMIKAAAVAPLIGALSGVSEVTRAAGASDELARLDGIGQAALVRSGRVSPRELVEAAIRRIEAVNPQLNAVIEKRFEQALVQASSKTLPAGPLRGVPILIKDVAIAGERNYLGSELLAKVDMRSAETDEFVLRAERAGMIIVGRTNVPELLSAPTTESKLHGIAHNPWDLTRSTGGSSGGSGAAVAALMVPLAQASDGGGSTRIPASANGLVGLKPSRGRVSTSPSTTAWVDITPAKSWVTRSVRDTALGLDMVAGPGFADSIVAPQPERSYINEVGVDPGKLRIGFMRQLPGNVMPLDPEAVLAVERTAKLLADLGHHVEEKHPATLDTTEHFDLISRYWPIKVVQRLSDAQEKLGRLIREGEVEPGVFQMLQFAREKTVFDFGVTLKQIYGYSKRMLAWYGQGFDLLMTPTTGCAAPLLGTLTKPGVTRDAMLWGGFAPLFNLTGQPAISLPLHWTATGLPIGVQLAADLWREDMLIRVAAQLEAAQPWHDRVPAVHA